MSPFSMQVAASGVAVFNEHIIDKTWWRPCSGSIWNYKYRFDDVPNDNNGS